MSEMMPILIELDKIERINDSGYISHIVHINVFSKTTQAFICKRELEYGEDVSYDNIVAVSIAEVEDNLGVVK